MVHSSLSRIGHVIGGPGAVIDALLAVIGPDGTLMMPSFNHGAARVFNLLTPGNIRRVVVGEPIGSIVSDRV